MEENLYKVLGVSKDATKADIEKAYKKLAVKYHPDINKSGGEEFKKISYAYSILNNSQKRRNYDLSLQYQSGGGNQGGYQSDEFRSFSKQFDFNGFEDIFKHFFKTPEKNKKNDIVFQPIRGEDIISKVNIPLKNIISGEKFSMKIMSYIACKDCKNNGVKNIIICHKCNGSGYTEKLVDMGVFKGISTVECNECMGKGIDPSSICDTCNGFSTVKVLKSISTNITSYKIKISGEGNSGRYKGKNGDLILKVEVINEYNEFIIDKDNGDITINIPITLLEALKGTRFEIPFFNKFINVKIPAHSKEKDIIKFEGLGLFKNSKLIIELSVIYPSSDLDLYRMISNNELGPCIERKVLIEHLRNY